EDLGEGDVHPEQPASATSPDTADEKDKLCEDDLTAPVDHVPVPDHGLSANAEKGDESSTTKQAAKLKTKKKKERKSAEQDVDADLGTKTGGGAASGSKMKKGSKHKNKGVLTSSGDGLKKTSNGPKALVGVVAPKKIDQLPELWVPHAEAIHLDDVVIVRCLGYFGCIITDQRVLRSIEQFLLAKIIYAERQIAEMEGDKSVLYDLMWQEIPPLPQGEHETSSCAHLEREEASKGSRSGTNTGGNGSSSSAAQTSASHSQGEKSRSTSSSSTSTSNSSTAGSLSTEKTSSVVTTVKEKTRQSGGASASSDSKTKHGDADTRDIKDEVDAAEESGMKSSITTNNTHTGDEGNTKQTNRIAAPETGGAKQASDVVPPARPVVTSVAVGSSAIGISEKGENKSLRIRDVYKVLWNTVGALG
ncbi:unnamed protein product, partial [Amoebophrya sp. A25]